MRYYLFFAFFSLVITDDASCQSKSSNRDPLKILFCSWRVIDNKFLQISGISDAEIKALSKKRMIFEKDKALIFDRAFSDPEYSVQNINTDSFLVQEFRIKGKDIGLRDKRCFLINITNENAKTQQTLKDELILADQRIYYIQDGVVFILAR